MGELGEIFREMKEQKQKKRHNNMHNSLRVLGSKGVGFESLNHGYHLRVEGVIDFYPTTGLWITVDKSERGRGVMLMIRYLKKKKIIN